MPRLRASAKASRDLSATAASSRYTLLGSTRATARTSGRPTTRRTAAGSGGGNPNARNAAFMAATIAYWLSTRVPSQSKSANFYDLVMIACANMLLCGRLIADGGNYGQEKALLFGSACAWSYPICDCE